MANITGLTIEDRIEIGTYYGSNVYTLYAFCTPAGAEQNVTVTVQNSNPGMFTLARTTAVTVGDNFAISGHSGETCVMANLYFNSAVTGNSIISFTDSNAGLVAQKTIYNNPVNVSPNIYISPSSITLSAETFVDNGRTGGPYKLKLGDVVSTGCVYDCPTPSNTYQYQKGPNNDSWENGRPNVGVDGDEYYLYLINQNSGETRWYRHEIFLQDTSGDVYINGFNNFVLYQEGSGSTSGDTSGSTSGDTSGYTPATGSCIEVTYDTSLYNGYTISSWPSGTKILGATGAVQSDYYAMIYTGWIDHAELEDGTQIPRTQYSTGFYRFGQEGIYTIRYYTSGRDKTYGIPLLPEFSFHDCRRVVSVKIIHSGDSTKDIQAIGAKAFAKTSLACITLPEGIRDIDSYAFSEVHTLSCITFPASLSNPVSQRYPSIAGWVLEYATSLNKIFAKGMTAPPIGYDTFKSIRGGGTLYYPVGSDYSTWLESLPNWTWATYDPYAVDTCDCTHDGENVPIIESGTTNPPSGTPYISLSGYSNNYLAGTGSCVSLPIIATNCTYSSFTATIDYNPNLTAHSVASVTEENGSLRLCLTSNPLTGDVQVAIITVTLYDTNGNSYLHYLGLNQYGNSDPTPPTPPDPPIPSGQTIDSGSTSHTITYSGCPLVFDHSASTGTWNTLPTVTTAGTTDNWSLMYNVPENDTDSARTITYYYLRYSGETCEDLVDTVSYTISQAAGSGTPTPSGETIEPGVWPWLGQSAITVNYVGDVRPTVVIGASGCSLVTGSVENSGIVPTYMEVPDLDIVRDIHSLYVDNSLDGEEVRAYRIRWTKNWNTGSTNKVSVVTFFVQDTSGNTYPVDFQITQTTGATVLFEPTQYNVSSNAGTAEFTARTINCNFTGAGLTLSAETYNGDWSTGPVYYEIVKVNDNQMVIRVNYPQNTGEERYWMPSFNTLTDAGNSYGTIRLTQSAYTPSPGEISATSITLNVASSITGTGQATTTVNPSDATVNLRYTSSNSTIATIDQNGRITVVRNGQVTICVKDLITGLQDCKTIRVTKGSTPGGDDDDLIYVYTGITVNDNEGHRYNITAEPGYKYGCLGKTYKTVSACEARYSLYYINAYGGVDVLPCKGKSSMKKDNITRYNYSRTFRNNTLEFENTNYLSEIKTTWQLHTGYMVDTQSEKMHHLVESTCVFLYDALEQTYTPVVMTDKTLEYKTFHNQGRTFYDYTINIEESQSKERR